MGVSFGVFPQQNGVGALLAATAGFIFRIIDLSLGDAFPDCFEAAAA